MQLIVLLFATAIVLHVVLWLGIKRFRDVPENARRDFARAAYREAAWWLLGTLIVIGLLGLLVSKVHRAQRTQLGAGAMKMTRRLI